MGCGSRNPAWEASKRSEYLTSIASRATPDHHAPPGPTKSVPTARPSLATMRSFVGGPKKPPLRF